MNKPESLNTDSIVDLKKQLCVVNLDVSNPIQVTQVRELRQLCFPSNSGQYEVWSDQDSKAMHFGVYHDQSLIACARLDLFPSLTECFYFDKVSHLQVDQYQAPLASIARLAVRPKFRRLGVGTLLDKHRISVAAKAQCRSIWAVTSDRFWRNHLTKLGFSQLGRGLPPTSPSSTLVSNETPFVLGMTLSDAATDK